MDNVIELSSSPEPSSRHSKTVKRKYNHDIIVLTDSDDETHPSPPKKLKQRPVAGTSSLRGSGSTLGSSHTMAGPSHNKVSHILPISPNDSPTRAPSQPLNNTSLIVPLFLPSDDDNMNDFDLSQPRSQRAGRSILANSDAVNPGGTPRTPSLKLMGPTQEDATVLPPMLPDVDPIDDYTARVLEIIPDVQLEYLNTLITQHLPTSKDKVVDVVVTALCEGTYPRSEGKGKRRRVEESASSSKSSKVKIDYADRERNFRGGSVYEQLALDQLFMDFPNAPLRYIRGVFLRNRFLYAPTHIFLNQEREEGQLPAITSNAMSRRKPKGKGKAFENEDFEAERRWLLEHYQSRTAEANPTASKETTIEEESYEDDDGIECGCCFSTYVFDKMIQCPDAHLFCKTCITSYASGLLGAHNPNVVCMDQSGCKLPFPESELRRMLSKKLMELFDRVKQTKEIEDAGLENLEGCPFCEYKVVIENENEKLFRCENEECAAVTCRGCKKLDHLPKSCKEVEDDKNLDGRHKVEEAMTRALMRNCPKCQKAFIKDMGCNKMTCPHCHTVSCYNCRQAIIGYNHFDQTGPGAPSTSTKCKLWEPVELRHHDEVKAAAKQAVEEYKQQNPDVDEESIKVDLQPPPQAAPVPGLIIPMIFPPLQLPMPVYNPYLPQPLNAMPAAAPLPVPVPVRAPRRRRGRRWR